MIRWALTSMLAERAAVLASCAGVATALVLVIVIQAVFAGESKQIVLYLEESGADVWVMQEGVSNVHMATSVVSRAEVSDVRRIAGVSALVPLHYVNATVQSEGSPSWFAYVVAAPAGSDMGGAWRMHSGSPIPAEGEVVVPAVMAARDDIAIGDALTVAGRQLGVVGFSEGTFSMANSLVFAHRADAIAIAGAGSPNYLLLRAEPGVSPAELAAAVNTEVEGVFAIDRANLVENDRRIALQMGGELILIMLFIGGAVAMLIITWTVSSFVARHSRELAVAKAVGARPGQIVAAVLIQTAVVAVTGYLGAIAVALVLTPVLGLAAPEVIVSVETSNLVQVGALCLAVSSLAAVLPAYRILRLDPAQVFS